MAGSDPAGDPSPGRRRRAAWAAVAWLLLLAHQARLAPVIAVVPYATLGLELLLGAVALAATSRVATRTGARRAVSAIAALLVAYSLNWALLWPRGYFVVHRAEFARIAALARAGEAGQSREYYGERLPVLLAHVSTDGRASGRAAGAGGGAPRTRAVFLPHWFGIPDDAGGYFYLAEDVDPDTVVDLYGRPVRVRDAQPLGGGWYWA